MKALLLCANWSRAGLLAQSHWDIKGIISLCFLRWSRAVTLFCGRSPKQCLSTSTTNYTLGGTKFQILQLFVTSLAASPCCAYPAWTLNPSSTDGPAHPEQEPPNLQDTKFFFPRTCTSSWLQKWKMNHYTFLFPTLKVSFSSQTTSLFVCQGKVFSAVHKNVGSKAQVTATRKKTRSMHYHIPAKGPTTFYLPQLLLGVSIIYTLSCVLVTFYNRICFCSLITKRDFKAIKFYWCRLLSI